MTLRAHLLALVLVPLVPVLVFSAVLLVGEARHQQQQIERGSLETARALSAAVDHRLAAATSALSALAVSSAIERRDWPVVYEEARALRASHDAWASVFVAHPDGQAIVDTRVPLGAPAPPTAEPEAFHRVATTGRADVSDLIVRDASRPDVLVLVPVTVDGVVRYVIGARIDVQGGLDALLARQQIPEASTVAVFDRRKIVVARSRAADRVVGTPVTERLAAHSSAAPEGWYEDVTDEGVRVYAAFSRSPVSGWTVAIGVPSEHVQASLRKSLVALVATALVVLLLAAGLALSVGRRVAAAIGSLSPVAKALARGAPLPVRPASAVHEVEVLAGDLAEAAAVLAQRASERQRVEAERSRLLARAEAARGQAEIANRAKDEFLATVSHELRTPLTAMLGWARVLRTRTLDSEALARGLEVIDRNARHQAQLIEDLLDVSRMITGKLRLDIRAVDLRQVVDGAADAVRGAADAKRLTIETSIAPDVGLVRADPDRLQQVIWNLLSNAIKFTSDGGRVTVAVQAAGRNAALVVRDTGKGIEPDFLPFVFDRFRQSDSGRAAGGLGLGLALVRHLTEMHGGTVTVASDGPGRGATFTVSVPRAVGWEATRPDLPRPPSGHVLLTGIRVLVVEDDADARQLLAMILEECDAQVMTAGSVPEALARFNDQRPDVVVSDLTMPVHDGYALVRQLRARAREEPRVPMIALTASARGEDRRRALAAGFDLHVAKPVEPAALVALVNELVGSRAGARHHEAIDARV
jgi:signal transduction histidine kinase/ActR/RegA family two-component response regulator